MDRYYVAGEPLKLKGGEIRLSSFSEQTGTFVGYTTIKKETVTDGLTSPIDVRVEFLLPFSIPAFGLGYYPYRPYVHPTELDPNHPDFLAWVNEEKGIVRRNRDGHTFQLSIDSQFELNGKYTLSDSDGHSLPYVSVQSDYKQFLAKAQELMRKSFTASQIFDGARVSALVLTFFRKGDKVADLVEAKLKTRIVDIPYGHKKIIRPYKARTSILQGNMKIAKGFDYACKIYYEYDNHTVGTIPIELIDFQ